MRKRVMAVILVFMLALSTAWVFAAGEEATETGYRMKPHQDKLASLTAADIEKALRKYKDMKSHWARTLVGKLTALEIVGGNGDGTFRPDAPLQVDQFIRMTVRAMGFKPSDAKAYPDIAKQYKLIEDKEFTTYSRAITREEATRLIMRALMLVEPAPDNSLDEMISWNLLDFEKITNSMKQSVLSGYRLGILAKSADGKFNPKGTLTRVQGCSLILKFLDKKVRTPFTRAQNLALKLPNFAKTRVDVGDREYETENPGEYVVFRPGIDEQMKAAVTVYDALPKSKGHSTMVYNPDGNGLIGAAFWENKTVFYENYFAFDMSIQTRLDAGFSKPYYITIYRAENVRKLHQEVVLAYFNYLFQNDSNNAITVLNKYIESCIQNSERKEEFFTFNKRKFYVSKAVGNQGFAISIYTQDSK